VAALLEIAHILAPLRHRATIVFVTFTAKESGRQGSQAFVDSYLKQQDPPVDLRGMINLDMLGSERGLNGRSDPRSLRLFSAEPNDSVSRQFARQLALYISSYATDINLKLQSAEERTGRFGDQQSFSAAGFASARFVQGLENAAPGAHDTLDNIQLAYLIRVTRAVAASVSILADGPLPPESVVMQPISPGMATLSWNAVPDAVGYVVALRRKSSLYFDQILNVTAQSHIDWDQFDRFANVAVGSVDERGRIGPLSAEYSIATLLRK
jgi:hypothetical protein